MIDTNSNLLYRYIRGSHLYGLNVATSDIDYGAVFMADPLKYLGTRMGYIDICRMKNLMKHGMN